MGCISHGATHSCGWAEGTQSHKMIEVLLPEVSKVVEEKLNHDIKKNIYLDEDLI